MQNDLGLPLLFIDTWSSTCGNCGKSCDPEKKTHSKLLGWGSENGDPGCKVKYEYVSSNYFGPEVEKWCKDMRPDLEYITYEHVARLYQENIDNIEKEIRS